MKASKKRSQKWDFCVFFSIHHLSLSSFFIRTKNHFIGVFIVLFFSCITNRNFLCFMQA